MRFYIVEMFQVLKFHVCHTLKDQHRLDRQKLVAVRMSPAAGALLSV